MKTTRKAVFCFLYFLSCCLFSVPVSAQKKTDFVTKVQRLFTDKFDDSTGKPNFLIYPTLAYTPETKTEVGIANVLLFYANNDRRNRLSEINTFYFYTAEKQYGVWFDHAIYGNEGKWFFLGKGKYQYFPIKYYGIGIGAPKEGYAVVENSSIQLRERVLRKINRNIYLGAEFDFQKIYNVTFTGIDPTNYAFPLGAQGTSNIGVGVGVVYDDRKNVLNARKGVFAELAFLNYSPALGSSNSFRSTQLDYRQYSKGFSKDQVFAWQASGMFNSGDVPFNQLALMGGENIMRGYYLGRFRDKNMLAAQVEYRILPFSFSNRFGTAAFLSTATVAPSMKTILSSSFKIAGGVGARYLIFKSKDIFVRIDVAFTREGTGYYFYIGEAF